MNRYEVLVHIPQDNDEGGEICVYGANNYDNEICLQEKPVCGESIDIGITIDSQLNITVIEVEHESVTFKKFLEGNAPKVIVHAKLSDYWPKPATKALAIFEETMPDWEVRYSYTKA